MLLHLLHAHAHAHAHVTMALPSGTAHLPGSSCCARWAQARRPRTISWRSPSRRGHSKYGHRSKLGHSKLGYSASAMTDGVGGTGCTRVHPACHVATSTERAGRRSRSTATPSSLCRRSGSMRPSSGRWPVQGLLPEVLRPPGGWLGSWLRGAGSSVRLKHA